MSVYDSDDWAAWVRGIRTNPDDIVRRLACSDWLEERGEEGRAALIRFGVENLGVAFKVQCGTTPTDWASDVYRKAFGLIGDCYAIDLGPTGVSYTVETGLMSAVTCPWSWWAEHGDTLCRREPVRRVELTTRPTWDECGPGWMLAGRDMAGIGAAASRLSALLLNTRWPAIPVDGWVLPDTPRCLRCGGPVTDFTPVVEEIYDGVPLRWGDGICPCGGRLRQPELVGTESWDSMIRRISSELLSD